MHWRSSLTANTNRRSSKRSISASLALIDPSQLRAGKCQHDAHSDNSHEDDQPRGQHIAAARSYAPVLVRIHLTLLLLNFAEIRCGREVRMWESPQGAKKPQCPPAGLLACGLRIKGVRSAIATNRTVSSRKTSPIAITIASRRTIPASCAIAP